MRRAAPAPKRQMVSPFIFFNQMGPAEFFTGKGIDLLPHPHIGLATVTYLYKGKIHHRDSLDTDQWIEPGAVNWMVAGHGITHSERTDGEIRARPHDLFGIRTWVALPESVAEGAAACEHAPKASLPLLEGEGKSLRLILGISGGTSWPPPRTASMRPRRPGVRATGGMADSSCRPVMIRSISHSRTGKLRNSENFAGSPLDVLAASP